MYKRSAVRSAHKLKKDPEIRKHYLVPMPPSIAYRIVLSIKNKRPMTYSIYGADSYKCRVLRLTTKAHINFCTFIFDIYFSLAIYWDFRTKTHSVLPVFVFIISGLNMHCLLFFAAPLLLFFFFFVCFFLCFFFVCAFCFFLLFSYL